VRYILVLQWPADSEADFDALISVEDQVETALGPYASVDGHDFGSGEMNIFVETDQPKHLPMRQRSYVRVQGGATCGRRIEMHRAALTGFSGRAASASFLSREGYQDLFAARPSGAALLGRRLW